MIFMLMGRYIVATILIFGIFVVIATDMAHAEHPRHLRRCPEDAVIVGFGDYEHGYWTRYRCIPRDDL